VFRTCTARRHYLYERRGVKVKLLSTHSKFHEKMLEDGKQHNSVLLSWVAEFILRCAIHRTLLASCTLQTLRYGMFKKKNRKKFWAISDISLNRWYILTSFNARSLSNNQGATTKGVPFNVLVPHSGLRTDNRVEDTVADIGNACSKENPGKLCLLKKHMSFTIPQWQLCGA